MSDKMALADLDRASLLSALHWWVEAGVDTLVDAEPRGWATAVHLPAPQATAETDVIAAPIAEPRPRADPTGVRIAAPSATTLAELRSEIEAFAGCPLRAPGRATVFADGNPSAPLMLIGEAPGAEEDRAGLPFIGDAGKLLDRMLAAIGRDRSSAYITNVTYWRPPGNRTPTTAEIETTLPFVHRHVSLARPKFIVAVGACATRALTGDAAGVLRLRGQWREVVVEGTVFPLLPMLHPAYLLRQPDAKRLAWADLLSLKACLDAD